MDSDFYLRKVQTLSPKAAKIALRILDGDPNSPVEWVLALRPTLAERSSESASFGTTDWMTIAAIESPVLHRLTSPFESREQRHARLWVSSLRQASRKAPRAYMSDSAFDSLE